MSIASYTQAILTFNTMNPAKIIPLWVFVTEVLPENFSERIELIEGGNFGDLSAVCFDVDI